jgi:hypothetical protein
MELVDLRVERLVVHEVFDRADDRTAVPPLYGTAVERLDPDALDAMRNRIVAAIASPAKCLQMTIAAANSESMCALAAQLIELDEQGFVEVSRRAADLLTAAQRSRVIPGGILIVFSGTGGVPTRRLAGVIKAEVHNGFTRESAEGTHVLRFLKNLLLTAQARLYKIGLFIEDEPRGEQPLPHGWKAYVYDETLTLGNRYGAALYFYEGFLGTKFPESSARQTKQFHELTKTFIRSTGLPEVEKVDLHNALVTYLRADQSPTISVATFGEAYLPSAELQDAYRNYMIEREFPEQAVAKDLSHVNGQLRTRKLVFANQVKVTAPASNFDDLVKIEAIDRDMDGNPLNPRWTRVTVKSDIAEQE